MRQGKEVQRGFLNKVVGNKKYLENVETSLKKFAAPQSELDLEEMLGVMKPRSGVAKASLLRYVNTKIKEEKANGSNAKLFALEAWRTQLEAADFDKEQDILFVSDFNKWLFGLTTSIGEADYQKTPWGKIRVDDKEVYAYLNTFLDAKFAFMKKLIYLYTKANGLGGLQGINEHYLYFKYIVRGGWENINQADFLHDWNEYMCTGAGQTRELITKKHEVKGLDNLYEVLDPLCISETIKEKRIENFLQGENRMKPNDKNNVKPTDPDDYPPGGYPGGAPEEDESTGEDIDELEEYFRDNTGVKPPEKAISTAPKIPDGALDVPSADAAALETRKEIEVVNAHAEAEHQSLEQADILLDGLKDLPLHNRLNNLLRAYGNRVPSHLWHLEGNDLQERFDSLDDEQHNLAMLVRDKHWNTSEEELMDRLAALKENPAKNAEQLEAAQKKKELREVEWNALKQQLQGESLASFAEPITELGSTLTPVIEARDLQVNNEIVDNQTTTIEEKAAQIFTTTANANLVANSMEKGSDAVIDKPANIAILNHAFPADTTIKEKTRQSTSSIIKQATVETVDKLFNPSERNLQQKNIHAQLQSLASIRPHKLIKRKIAAEDQNKEDAKENRVETISEIRGRKKSKIVKAIRSVSSSPTEKPEEGENKQPGQKLDKALAKFNSLPSEKAQRKSVSRDRRKNEAIKRRKSDVSDIVKLNRLLHSPASRTIPTTEQKLQDAVRVADNLEHFIDNQLEIYDEFVDIAEAKSVELARRGIQEAILTNSIALHHTIKKNIESSVLKLLRAEGLKQVRAAISNESQVTIYEDLCDEMEQGNNPSEIVNLAISQLIKDGKYPDLVQILQKYGIAIEVEKNAMVGLGDEETSLVEPLLNYSGLYGSFLNNYFAMKLTNGDPLEYPLAQTNWSGYVVSKQQELGRATPAEITDEDFEGIYNSFVDEYLTVKHVEDNLSKTELDVKKALFFKPNPENKFTLQEPSDSRIAHDLNSFLLWIENNANDIELEKLTAKFSHGLNSSSQRRILGLLIKSNLYPDGTSIKKWKIRLGNTRDTAENQQAKEFHSLLYQPRTINEKETTLAEFLFLKNDFPKFNGFSELFSKPIPWKQD